MQYQDDRVRAAADVLKEKFLSLDDKKLILKEPEFTGLLEHIKTLSAGEVRASFGRDLNILKKELENMVREANRTPTTDLYPIDITAPFDVNIKPLNRPGLLPAENASHHPLMAELARLLDIFGRMGFSVMESRELDDDYHMFGSLNFPPDHPVRDDYDTFITEDGLFAPAHTSTMQNRVLKANKPPIRYVIPGRVFRNEDLDARHEHTFYQLEGVYVDQGINAGNLLATLKTFLEAYFGQNLEIKTQPFYFPFTEPSFELASSCPFCQKAGCHICSHTGWIELLGCGMIHPNVLREGGIDPKQYSGFAWGGGIDRLVMIKFGIEDVRHFHSGNLKFLRQFS